MTDDISASVASDSYSRRAAELFDAHMLGNYQKTDRMFAVLMVVQFFAGIGLALWVSPRTWAGTASEVHPHVWAALIIGGLTNLYPAALAWFRPGETLTRHVVAVGQVLTSALLIHLTGGRIETHFHVFGSLAFIAFYRDWKVLVPPTIVVAADHFLRGVYFPQSVYGILVPEPWRFLEHAFWVVFEDVVLVLACLRGVEESREIARRACDLGRLNESLAGQVTTTRKALQQVQEAQAQLVQSEKLASLGALVAGVAHEVNTPVGVGVTAASTLQEQVAKLKRQHLSGGPNRSELERFVAVADETCNMVLTNLQRAANLIQSFKQVAVDQSSSERRQFALKPYIHEVLVMLSPKLKKTRHRVDISCPADLEVESYPGAIAQILTNLVENSLIHAYKEGDAGHIMIDVGGDDGWTRLAYRDDGCGIPQDHVAKVFDPFFTTRRGAGGSGLGLHIVYNLVTQRLGGTIQLNSEPGRGAEFVVRFPAALQKAAA